MLKAGLEYRVGEVEALEGEELAPEYREARLKSPEEEAQEELEEWEPDLPTNRPVCCLNFGQFMPCASLAPKCGAQRSQRSAHRFSFGFVGIWQQSHAGVYMWKGEGHHFCPESHHALPASLPQVCSFAAAGEKNLGTGSTG